MSRKTKQNTLWVLSGLTGIIGMIVGLFQNKFWGISVVFISIVLFLVSIYDKWPKDRNRIGAIIIIVIAYFGFDFWQNRVLKEEISKKMPQSTHDNKAPLENIFYDFRLISEFDCELQLEVWYYYDGSFGTEMIYIDINLLDADQIPLDSACGATGSQILAEKIKIIAKIDLDCSVVGESEYIELCMEHSIRGGAHFYCETFPLEKTWDCK